MADFDPAAFKLIEEVGVVVGRRASSDEPRLAIHVTIKQYADNPPALRVDRVGTRKGGASYTTALGGLSAPEAEDLAKLLRTGAARLKALG